MITPTGSLAQPLSLLADMVVQSSTFQTRAGIASPDDLRMRVHFRDVFGQQSPKPLAIVRVGDRHQYGMAAGGDRHYLRPSGSVLLDLATEVPGEYRDDRYMAELDAANFFGGVLDDVVALSATEHDDPGATTTYLPITGGSMLAFDETPEEEWPSLGRFHFAAYALEWGLQF